MRYPERERQAGPAARHPALTCSVLLSVLLTLGGCGGGGGGGGGGRPPDDFATQWGLRHVGAGAAYGNLAALKGSDAEPGSGVTIGFIDSGIDLDHPAFAGKTVTEELLSGASDETGETFSHGTAVASVAAAARSSPPGEMQGVAWAADIVMFGIPAGSGVHDYRPVSLARLAADDADWKEQLDHILAWRDGGRRVDVLNLSIGFQGIIDGYTEPELRASLPNAIAAMAQAGAGEKTPIVWATGNAHGAPCDPSASEHCEDGAINAVSVEVLPGLAARIAELRGHSVAVVALSPDDGQIASFSNRCGIAAEYCIAAPGKDVRAAYFGPDEDGLGPVRGYASVDGTSVAAPMVAGGLALMKQLFRDQLSSTELVTRLFKTADKSGAYADAAVYGQGSMNLGAATSPVGVLALPSGGTVGRNGVSLASGGSVGRNGVRLASTRLLPGAAFGDALQRSLAAREIMALDALGAPFWYRLGNFTAPAPETPVSARLRRFLAPEPAGGEPAPGSLGIARLERTVEVRGSHLALAEGAVKATLAGSGGLSAAAFTTKGVPGQAPAVGAALSWRRAGLPLGVRAGWIGERETLLGSVGEGAFGRLAANTAFLGLDAHTDLGRWRIGANAEFGFVAPAARGGLVTRVSPLATSAFALHAGTALAGSGRLRFSVSQPLRVESGRAWFTAPAGRTRAGSVWYGSAAADLAPSGRQMDFAGQWRRPLAEGELRLGAVYSHRPGHRRAAHPEMTFLAGWRREF